MKQTRHKLVYEKQNLGFRIRNQVNYQLENENIKIKTQERERKTQKSAIQKFHYCRLGRNQNQKSELEYLIDISEIGNP